MVEKVRPLGIASHEWEGPKTYKKSIRELTNPMTHVNMEIPRNAIGQYNISTIQVSEVFDSASSPARHAADRNSHGERQVTNYHSKGPSRHPILRWFKVRFVRTGTKMACRYIIEVPSLL